MLGYEPPQPKLWKALLGAGIVTFPVLYIADVALWKHQPGLLFLIVAALVTLILGCRMYLHGTQSLRRIPIGVPLNRLYGASFQPPSIHETPETD